MDQATYSRFRLHRFAVDGIFVATLGIAAIKLIAWIERVDDLRMFDETLYLRSGLQLPVEGLPDPQWGPLYSLWYYGLSWLESDPVRLQFLNQQILWIATAIALYLYLRTLKIHPLISLGFTVIYLYSSILPIDPRPTHLALLVLLIFLMLANYAPSRIAFLSLMGIGFAVIAFLRPEYGLSWILTGLCLGIGVARKLRVRSQLSRLDWISLLAWGGISLALLLGLGNPLAGGRSWFAFSQHFALNWTTWVNGEFNPWDNHVEIIPTIFGEADSLSEAFFQAPGMVIRHIAANLNRYLNESIGILRVSFADYGFSPVFTHKWVFLEIGGVWLLLAWLIRYRRAWMGNGVSPHGRVASYRVLYPWMAVSCAVLPSALLVYPRGHYLIIQSVLGLGAIAFLLNQTLPKIRPPRWRGAMLLSVLLLLLTPNLAYGWCVAPGWCALPRNAGSVTRPHAQTVEFLRHLQIQQPVGFLDADGGHAIYLPANYTSLIPWDKYGEEPADQFFQRRQVTMMLITPTLTGHPLFRRDPYFKALLTDPNSFGFTRLPIPETEFSLLIRDDLSRSTP